MHMNYDVLEESFDASRSEDPESDLILKRAELMNRYKPPNHESVSSKDEPLRNRNTSTTRQQTNVSADSGMRSVPSLSNDHYGSIESTDKQSTNGNIQSISAESKSILYQSGDENSDSEK